MPRARLEPLCVKILVGTAALWALSFLNLALALPREFARATDPDDDAAEQPKIQPSLSPPFGPNCGVGSQNVAMCHQADLFCEKTVLNNLP
jgi:hypothetical protein